MKRTFAIIAILLLAGIYLATLIFSMMKSAIAFALFKASLHSCFGRLVQGAFLMLRWAEPGILRSSK